jgi:hypothetical protein
MRCNIKGGDFPKMKSKSNKQLSNHSASFKNKNPSKLNMRGTSYIISLNMFGLLGAVVSGLPQPEGKPSKLIGETAIASPVLNTTVHLNKVDGAAPPLADLNAYLFTRCTGDTACCTNLGYSHPDQYVVCPD